MAGSFGSNHQWQQQLTPFLRSISQSQRCAKVRASVGVGADAACVATLEGGSVSRAAGLLARRLWLSYRPMVVPMSLPTLSWKKKAVAFLTVDMAYWVSTSRRLSTPCLCLSARVRQVHRFGMLQRCEDLLIALLSYFQDICLHGRSHTLRYLSSLRFCPSRNSEQSTHANACQKTTRHGPHGTASGLSARDQQTPCSCQRSSVRIWRPLRSQPQCIFCRRHSARGLRPRMAACHAAIRGRSLDERGGWTPSRRLGGGETPSGVS